MRRVKIYGAGSIGNHLAYACRTMGWSVVVCDVDAKALDRMKKDIYPARYGRWDEEISLCLNKEAPKGNFDLIIVGTPPEYHLSLALEALDEHPKGLLIEKPLCPPYDAKAETFIEKAKKSSTKIFVGYTHVVAKSMVAFLDQIKSNLIGEVVTLDVEWREHWEGIFKAHPWLKGPEDTYLGYWNRGGGASGEHSHGINMWQHVAGSLGFGTVSEVTASLSYVNAGAARYDDLCFLNLRTDKGMLGRVVEDVVTKPSKKCVRVQGTAGILEWYANYDSKGDAIVHMQPGQEAKVTHFPKTRPDDFLMEIRHVDAILKNPDDCSPMDIRIGYDTVRILNALHEGQQETQGPKAIELTQSAQ